MAGMARAMGATLTGGAKNAWQKLKLKTKKIFDV